MLGDFNSRDVLRTKHQRMGVGGSLALTDCMYNFNERSLKKTYKPGAESHSREGFNFNFLFCSNGIFVCLAAEPTVNNSYLSL